MIESISLGQVGFNQRIGVPGPDPFASSVTSLLRFNETLGVGVGGTVTDDVTANIWTYTPGSFASIVQTNLAGSFNLWRYGLFRDDQGILDCPASSNFAITSNWTLDFHYNSSLSGTYTVFDNRGGSSEGIAIYIINGVLSIATNLALLATGTTTMLSTSTDAVEVVYSGGNWMGFVNGNLEFTVADARTFALAPPAKYGADTANGARMRGNLVFLRITQAARHTAAFTPKQPPYYQRF